MTRRNLDVADLTKNIFDYANPDYKNPDFTNTKILDFFLFLYFGLNLYLLRLSAPTENKTWMLF